MIAVDPCAEDVVITVVEFPVQCRRLLPVFVPLHDPSFVGWSNLTATKARLLLMARLIKFGSLPPAADPDHPTPEEAARTRTNVAAYQVIFDTH
jgi:hypothetical protein